MVDLQIRTAKTPDLPRLTEIYNYYVMHTPVTFDVEPYTVEQRAVWFEQFANASRYRLLVAEQDHTIVGYACTSRFRPKTAYDTTVETSIYCIPNSAGKGIGTRLYETLFQAVANEDIRRIVAGYVLPNPASVALHRRFGFKPVGTFTENGRKFGRYWDVTWTERPLHL